MHLKTRVLIACESSGMVRRAFQNVGCDAYSCDLKPAEDGERSRHFTADVFSVLADYSRFDILIAHPPCTYLCSSGLHWNRRRPERLTKTQLALQFVADLMNCGIPRIAIENPTGCISTRIKMVAGLWRVVPPGQGDFPATQYVQPYEFGEDASKNTGLWLFGLPALKPTGYFPPRLVCTLCGAVNRYGIKACTACGNQDFKPRWSNQTDSGQNKLAPGPQRATDRARTYAQIAKAMADQWGKL